ncbi:MAG: hypothetical protein ACI9OJ_002747 [Myxococcota bacterium]|jgi:hypothetical protein
MGIVVLAIMALQAPINTTQTDDLRALMAHTETATIGLAYRGGLRGLIGARIPMLREEDHNGFGFYLAALVELHNEPTSDQVLPNENWRAYVALDFNWRHHYRTGRVRQLDVTLSIEHESDHWTGRADGGVGQLNIQDLRARVSLLMPLKDAGFVVSTEMRTYIASCSQERRCGDFSGNATIGGAVDVLFDLQAGNAEFRGFSWFAAFHGSAIVPAGKMGGEARAVVHTGARHITKLGQWQYYAVFWYGNTVGINRSDIVIHGGGGFRYSF